MDMKNTLMVKVFCLVCTAVLLAGCGLNLVAPEGKVVNEYLEKVQANCGTLNIVDGQSIDSTFEMNSNETIFIDLISDLAAGRLSKTEFADTFNRTFSADDNEAVINCLFAQLGNQGTGSTNN